jgi:hypothetical protein
MASVSVSLAVKWRNSAVLGITGRCSDRLVSGLILTLCDEVAGPRPLQLDMRKEVLLDGRDPISLPLYRLK